MPKIDTIQGDHWWLKIAFFLSVHLKIYHTRTSGKYLFWFAKSDSAKQLRALGGAQTTWEVTLLNMVLVPLSYPEGRVGSSEDNRVWCQPVSRTTRVWHPECNAVAGKHHTTWAPGHLATWTSPNALSQRDRQAKSTSHKASSTSGLKRPGWPTITTSHGQPGPCRVSIRMFSHTTWT